ncbi:hypothetical protein ACFX13_031698 [Malus domestica]
MEDADINEDGDSQSVDQSSQNGSNHVPPFIYSQHNMRRGLAKYIASTAQLLTSAEHVRFERFIKSYVQPQYSSVPLNLIRGDCLKLFNEKKNFLTSELCGFVGMFSCTCSFWTSSDDQIDFVCVTAHFIDSAWKLQKRIIAFRMLEYDDIAFRKLEHPFNDKVIFECVMDIFREYTIDDRVLSITFDNVTSNDATVEMFRHSLRPFYGEFSHMKCLGDVINSIAVQGLKLMEAHIEKIRRAILCLASSPARQEEFSALCESRGLDYKKFKPDMKTHWNSTLLMLQSCVDYNAAITDFYNGNHDSDLLCEADWELGFVFMEFLSVFYEVAVSFGSRVYSSSSCMALHHLFCISFTFSKHKAHSGFKAIYDIMESEFRSYCEFMLPSFCLAKAMDPRMKLCGVQHIVNNISKCLSTPLKFDAKALDTMLHNLYKVYESRFPEATEVTEPCTTSDSKRKRVDIHASWREYVRQEDIKQYGPTELHVYLGINYAGSMTLKEYDNLDVLAWWKSREGMFPLLSVMARDLLTPSVCAIAPEFAFSSAGKQVLDHRRSMQSPKMLDCMFCLKDWEDARHRTQKWTDDMVEYFADSDQSDAEEE